MSNGFDNIFKSSFITKATKFIHFAIKEPGYKQLEDFNNGSPTGFGIIKSTIVNGVRWNSARVFLTPIIHVGHSNTNK